MAPRRGGGGSYGGSSSSSPVCPGFLDSPSPYGSIQIAYYVSYCLFFVLTFGALIYTCCVVKRATRLLRLLLVVLSFMSLAWGLVLISRTLSECYVFDNSFDVYNFAIAYGIFFNIGQWLLLFIQVWGVNRLLSQRLGSAQAMVKIITLAITGLMGVLTVALIGLTSYNNWQRMARDGFSRLSTLEATVKLTVAYWVLYLISVIVGGALSLVLLTKMRSKSIAVRDVMKRTIALIIFMILWVIFNLVPYAAALQEMFIGLDAEAALYYLDGFFQIFSYFAIISLCKLNFWKESATHTAYNNVGYGQPEYAPAQPPMQQYAYNGQPGQQQYYQQQQPVHNGVPAPANSNGHMA